MAGKKKSRGEVGGKVNQILLKLIKELSRKSEEIRTLSYEIEDIIDDAEEAYYDHQAKQYERLRS